MCSRNGSEFGYVLRLLFSSGSRTMGEQDYGALAVGID